MKLQPVTSHQKKLRGFGNSQTLLLSSNFINGCTETGRKSRTFFMAEPLPVNGFFEKNDKHEVEVDINAKNRILRCCSFFIVNSNICVILTDTDGIWKI